jgi:protein involved in polysaccharide export with SLBB domain
MKRLLLHRILLTIPLVLTIHCASRTQLAAPPATWEVTTAPEQEYALGYGDILEIKLFNNDRFNQTAVVRPDGRITLDRIGDIRVTGITPAGLDSLITEQYAKFMRAPEVTVVVKQFGAANFYVLGQVHKPGGYALEQNATILQALALAGGTTDQAEIKSVMVIRPLENKQVAAFRLDVNQYLHGKSSKMNEGYYIKAKDLIYVPKSYIANINAFVMQFYDLVLPPVDMYVKALWWQDR